MDYRKGQLYQLELSALSADPDQPRKTMDPQAIGELAASISQLGMLEPILFRVDETGRLIAPNAPD